MEIEPHTPTKKDSEYDRIFNFSLSELQLLKIAALDRTRARLLRGNTPFQFDEHLAQQEAADRFRIYGDDTSTETYIDLLEEYIERADFSESVHPIDAFDLIDNIHSARGLIDELARESEGFDSTDD